MKILNSFSTITDDKEFLLQMLNAAEFVLKLIKGKSPDSFFKDEIERRALATSVSALGGAVNEFSVNFKNAHQKINWERMSKASDNIIHQYYSIDYSLIIQVINQDIPELEYQIKSILNKK